MSSGEIKKVAATTNATNVASAKRMKEFKQFDIVSDYSDHYFASLNLSFFGKKKDCFTNANSGVLKKIMQEWKILKNSLPEAIYVRAYEERMDLLRAVIVGAAGTPYHDGLFFFDFAFPPDYPNSPPKAYYHSHGYHLNPNLYSDGKVCLSLLNTWNGEKEARWDPCKSTILQVLVSLQGLVLNEKPYYNEPGRRHSQNRKLSKRYNSMMFLISCRTMLVLLEKPPRSFEGFVHEHFCTRANFILQAFKANTNCSAAFSHYQDNVPHSFYEGSVKLHQKTKLYLELETAFTKKAASVTKLAFTDDSKNEALVLHTTNNEGLYQSKELWGLIGLVLAIVCLPLLFSVFLELVG
ncbi:putative ubiquitin-conjugating enzyme E2 38 [Quercus suber]|uniref:putative ubiquitin-conjugating enzyme E2 38 n=1 Tax=Quercus suber TaxID=58331 RepID=UPI0032DFED36